MIDKSIYELLKSIDTPTVCNALEILLGGRTGYGFTKDPVVCLDLALPPIVGYARTARIRAAAQIALDPKIVRENRLAYYEYAASGEGPNIVVIEDEDWPRPVGAFWGEVNVAIHKGLGLQGTLTSGLMRDLGSLDPGYQLIAGAIGPSHANVNVVDFGGTITVFGMRVEHDDLVHADRHGAVVVPAEVLGEMASAVASVTDRETPILKAARSADFTIEQLRKVWRGDEEIH